MGDRPAHDLNLALVTKALPDEISRCSGCDEGIDPETADQLDSVLARLDLKHIRVDRAKLAESWESWIHVEVRGSRVTACRLAWRLLLACRTASV